MDDSVLIDEKETTEKAGEEAIAEIMERLNNGDGFRVGVCEDVDVATMLPCHILLIRYAPIRGYNAAMSCIP